MVETAPLNYDTIIDRQHKRIQQLEADLARYTDKIRLLKTRATDSHHAALTAAAHVNANDYARLHAAHMHAVMAMAVAPPPLVPPPHSPAAAAAAPAPAPAPATGASASVDEEEKAGRTRYWTEMEHNQFLYAVKLFGPKNYVAISQFVGTRTPKQVRTHAQKYQMKLEREAKKRRAQAAAVAAVSGPQAAAAAACAAAAAAAARCAEQNAGEEGNLGKAREIRCTDEGAVKSETDVAQSASTSPMLEGECGAEEMHMLRMSACSPVSNDDDLEDTESGRDAEGEMEKRYAERGSGAVAMCTGLRKNVSLGNLADYDDFMRRITTDVHESRGVDGAMFEDEASNELDMDMLPAHSKSEQFEDSLLVDL